MSGVPHLLMMITFCFVYPTPLQFQDELGCGEQDAEGREEDEERDGEPPPPAAPNFNVPQAMR